MLDSLVRLLEPLSALVLVAAMFAASARRAESRVRIYRAQAAALSLWLCLAALTGSRPALYVAAALGFVLKCVLIPRLLASTEALRARVESHDGPGGALSLLAAGALAAGARWASATLPGTMLWSRETFAAGLASALAGLFLVATRRRARAQVAGLLVTENGVALAALAASPSLRLALLLLALELLLLGLVAALRAPSMASGIEEAENPQMSEAEA